MAIDTRRRKFIAGLGGTATDDIPMIIKTCRQGGTIVPAGTNTVIIAKFNAVMDEGSRHTI
jgi:hypothetical protein